MTAEDMVTNIRELPPISNAVLRLVSLLDRTEGSNEDVVQVLKQDPILTAKLLRACNSPAVALEEPVTSVDQAVLILGYTRLLQMVVALAFCGAMSVRLPGYEMEGKALWQHSVLAAFGAEAIVRHDIGAKVDPAIAFTVGLLHDIGKVVINQFLDLELRTEMRRQIANGLAAIEAEHEILGTNHAEVGANLLQRWRLPAEISEAVANHHSPRIESRERLSAVAHLANCLAHLAGEAPGWESYAVYPSQPVVAGLGIDAAVIEQLIVEVSCNYAKTHQLMTLA